MSIFNIFKKATALCAICGKPLRDPESVKLGIGPSHLKSKSPQIQAKVDAFLKKKGMTRDQAFTMVAGASPEKGRKGPQKAPGRPEKPAAGSSGPSDLPEDLLDVEDPTGLMDKIRSDPNFQIIGFDQSVSETAWVIDNRKQPPERWLAKKSEYPDDILAEQVAAGIGIQAGVPLGSTMWASSPEADEKWMLQRYWTEEYGGKLLNGSEMDRSKKTLASDDIVEGFRQGPDPAGPLRMALYDYLINNHADRHNNNYGVVESEDGGYELAVWDQSLAFDLLDDPWPEDQPYFEDFLPEYRGAKGLSGGGANAVVAAYKIAGGEDNDETRAELRAQIEDIIADFDEVDTDAVLAQLERDGSGEGTLGFGEVWLDLFEQRREMLAEDVDALVETIISYSKKRKRSA